MDCRALAAIPAIPHPGKVPLGQALGLNEEIADPAIAPHDVHPVIFIMGIHLEQQLPGFIPPLIAARIFLGEVGVATQLAPGAEPQVIQAVDQGIIQLVDVMGDGLKR